MQNHPRYQIVTILSFFFLLCLQSPLYAQQCDETASLPLSVQKIWSSALDMDHGSYLALQNANTLQVAKVTRSADGQVTLVPNLFSVNISNGHSVHVGFSDQHLVVTENRSQQVNPASFQTPAPLTSVNFYNLETGALNTQKSFTHDYRPNIPWRKSWPFYSVPWNYESWQQPYCDPNVSAAGQLGRVAAGLKNGNIVSFHHAELSQSFCNQPPQEYTVGQGQYEYECRINASMSNVDTCNADGALTRLNCNGQVMRRCKLVTVIPEIGEPFEEWDCNLSDIDHCKCNNSGVRTRKIEWCEHKGAGEHFSLVRVCDFGEGQGSCSNQPRFDWSAMNPGGSIYRPDGQNYAHLRNISFPSTLNMPVEVCDGSEPDCEPEPELETSEFSINDIREIIVDPVTGDFVVIADLNFDNTRDGVLKDMGGVFFFRQDGTFRTFVTSYLKNSDLGSGGGAVIGNSGGHAVFAIGGPKPSTLDFLFDGDDFDFDPALIPELPKAEAGHVIFVRPSALGTLEPFGGLFGKNENDLYGYSIAGLGDIAGPDGISQALSLIGAPGGNYAVVSSYEISTFGELNVNQVLELNSAGPGQFGKSVGSVSSSPINSTADIAVVASDAAVHFYDLNQCLPGRVFGEDALSAGGRLSLLVELLRTHRQRNNRCDINLYQAIDHEITAAIQENITGEVREARAIRRLTRLQRRYSRAYQRYSTVMQRCNNFRRPCVCRQRRIRLRANRIFANRLRPTIRQINRNLNQLRRLRPEAQGWIVAD